MAYFQIALYLRQILNLIGLQAVVIFQYWPIVDTLKLQLVKCIDFDVKWMKKKKMKLRGAVVLFKTGNGYNLA